MNTKFKRLIYDVLRQRLREPRRFIEVLSGPRHTGKTTIARQINEETRIIAHYASADEPALKDRIWIEQQWQIARNQLSSAKQSVKSYVLILDEIQKITGWSETIKRLWDQDSASGSPLKVVLLGSSPLLVQHGLTESLAGRFEVIPVTQWSFTEMKEAFGWEIEQYVLCGGYPGAAPLVQDQQRWSSYIKESLIETTVSRDILLMTQVNKPALLRRLFDLGCRYSGQILSYQKMLGQLQDAGNTTTLAHYLSLLEGAGLATGLQKYAGQQVRRRSSSPKLQVLDTALITSQSDLSFDEARGNGEFWGRLVESSVGAALANGLKGKQGGLYYWANRNREVDFVLARGGKLVAIEVKSGRRKTCLPGIDSFSKEFSPAKKLLVGTEGIPLDEFFQIPVEQWFGDS